MPLTRRLILQKARRHPPSRKATARLRRIVGERFQVLFHSPPGVLFTIPSRYYPLSVTREYSALPGGPGRFTADSTGPLLLGDTATTGNMFSSTGLSPSTDRPSQATSTNTLLYHCCS